MRPRTRLLSRPDRPTRRAVSQVADVALSLRPCKLSGIAGRLRSPATYGACVHPETGSGKSAGHSEPASAGQRRLRGGSASKGSASADGLCAVSGIGRKPQDAVFENATRARATETIRAAAKEVVNFAKEYGYLEGQPCCSWYGTQSRCMRERSISADDARCREIQNGDERQRRLTRTGNCRL